MSENHPPPPPEPKFIFRGGMESVSCLDFGLDRSLYAGTQDGFIHVWDLLTNRKKASYRVGNSVCLAVKVFNDRLVAQSKGEGVSLWNLSQQFELIYKFHNPYIGFCKLETDSIDICGRAFIPAENSDVKVINLNSHELERTFVCPADKLGEVMVLKYCRYLDQSLLLVAYESGDIYLWDVSDSNHKTQFKIDNVPMAIDFDQDKGQGVIGTESDSVVIFGIDTRLNFTFIKNLVLTNPGVSAVSIRPDKKIVVLGCWDGNIRVYSWKSGRILAILSEHTETINALVYSSRVITIWGTVLLAAASKDKSISLWSFL